jgi:hypothetical protein
MSTPESPNSPKDHIIKPSASGPSHVDRRRFIKSVGALTFSMAIVDGLIPISALAQGGAPDTNCAVASSVPGSSAVSADIDCGKTTDLQTDGKDGDCGLSNSYFGGEHHEDNDCVALPAPGGGQVPVSDGDCGKWGSDTIGGSVDGPHSDSDCKLPAAGATTGIATGGAGADDDCGTLSEPYGLGYLQHPDSDCPPAAQGQPKNAGDDSK